MRSNVSGCKTKRYRTTLWLVHNLISNIVPKKMGVPLVWRLKLAHYVPKIGKSNKKRCLATIWPLRWCQAKCAIFLLPLFIVPLMYPIIHAWHYKRERYRIICTYDVHRVPYTRTIRTIFWIHTVRVLCCFGHRCCCCTALIFGWRNKSREDKRATKWYYNVWSKPSQKLVVGVWSPSLSPRGGRLALPMLFQLSPVPLIFVPFRPLLCGIARLPHP